MTSFFMDNILRQMAFLCLPKCVKSGYRVMLKDFEIKFVSILFKTNIFQKQITGDVRMGQNH